MLLIWLVIFVFVIFLWEVIIVIFNVSFGLFNIRELNIFCDVVLFYYFVNVFVVLLFVCCCVGFLGYGIGKGNGLGKIFNFRGFVFVIGFNGYW